MNPIGERSCYDEGKRCAETLTFDYKREHGLEVRVARIFNTYGPRMALDDGRVVSNFVKQAIEGTPMTIYGDGSQTRSFQYVSDLVKGLVALMDGEHTVRHRERSIALHVFEKTVVVYLSPLSVALASPAGHRSADARSLQTRSVRAAACATDASRELCACVAAMRGARFRFLSTCCAAA